MNKEIQEAKDKQVTDYPDRHPSPMANEKREEESLDELDEWWALQQFAIIKHLGS